MKKPKAKSITLQSLKKEIKRLDPTLEPDDIVYETALIMLAGLVCGANIKRVARFTELPLSLVREKAKALRENKIWVGSKTSCEWFKKGEGGVAFWCDVLAVEGLVKRVILPKKAKK